MNELFINIGIFEQSNIIFEGLSAILHKSKNHFRIYRTENFAEIQRLAENQRINLVIINPNYILQYRNEFLQLKKLFPTVKWLGLVYHYFDKELLNCLDALIQITDSQNEIFNVISNLSDMESEPAESLQTEQLSIREKEVLVQLVNGLSNKEIADRLNISIHTVITHRKNITQKTGIKSQSGLTIFAISNKIINL